MSKVDERKKELIVYLPDTRGVEISRFGKGNLKIGMGVYTYSRLAGNYKVPGNSLFATCPGSTTECEAICYAKRITGPLLSVYTRNSETESVPAELPADCKMLRLHISGDFTTEHYIDGWTALLQRNPQVICWAYTRSWRVAELLPALERLRALPNMQLFASVDKSMPELPPAGWRRAWIAGDARLVQVMPQHDSARAAAPSDQLYTLSYHCPEQTKRQPNCEACGYCQLGKKNDVTFQEH